MEIRKYLPSGRFSTLLLSLILSAVLIGGVEYSIHPHYQENAELQLATNTAATDNSNWQQVFASSTALADDNAIEDQAQQLINSVATNNLTDTIGRSLLINTGSAEAQGIGSDADTQNQIVSTTLSQIQSAETPASNAYTASDIMLEPTSTTTLHAFGNAFLAVLNSYPELTYVNTMSPASIAVDNNDPTTLSKLPEIAKNYTFLANQIITIPTPVVFASIELELANNYAQMAQASTDMETVLTDPVRGLAGVQEYDSLANTNFQVFTEIAETFQTQGILFSNSELGAGWAVFLVEAQQAEEAAAEAQAQSAQPSATAAP